MTISSSIRVNPPSPSPLDRRSCNRRRVEIITSCLSVAGANKTDIRHARNPWSCLSRARAFGKNHNTIAAQFRRALRIPNAAPRAPQSPATGPWRSAGGCGYETSYLPTSRSTSRSSSKYHTWMCCNFQEGLTGCRYTRPSPRPVVPRSLAAHWSASAHRSSRRRPEQSQGG